MGSSFWWTLTRLGEATLLGPALAGVLAWIAWQERSLAVPLRWLGAIAVAATLTALTKIAFIGYGIGHAPTDFTGISGHAMSAAAMLPMLACAATRGAARRHRRLALAFAAVLAVVVGYSRVRVGVHSPSEVAAGLLLGACTAVFALEGRRPERRVPPWLPALMCGWLVIGPAGAAPPSPTHGWVVRIALAVSGRSQPYTRRQMHEDYRPRASSSEATSLTVTPLRSSQLDWCQPANDDSTGSRSASCAAEGATGAGALG
jgi:membrane-associated phospholipid phosphatase